jgi:hypothetical protein
VEDQRGDTAFAGEVIMTFSDTGGYSDVECDILFSRELDDDEIEELLKSVTNILSGEGNVTVFTSRQVACRGFSLLEDTESGFIEGEESED